MAQEAMHEGIDIQIPVGKETWTIGSDKHNFVLGRKSLKTGRKDKPDGLDWDNTTTSFHGSLESVLKHAQKLMIKNTQIRTFEELQAAIKKTGEQLMGMYEGLSKEDF